MKRLNRLIIALLLVLPIFSFKLLADEVKAISNQTAGKISDYITQDYKALFAIDINKFMNSNNVAFKDFKSNIESVVARFVKKNDMKGYKAIDWQQFGLLYFVLANDENFYGLLETKMDGDKLIANLCQHYNKYKPATKNIDGFDFTLINKVALCKLNKNLIILTQKTKLPWLVKMFVNAKIPKLAKNNAKFQNDYTKLGNKPAWSAFNLEKNENGYGFLDVKDNFGVLTLKYSAPNDKDGYNEAKLKMAMLPLILSSAFARQPALKSLGKTIQKDLKLKFDDSSKSITFNFEFDYKKYSETLTNLTIIKEAKIK